MDKQNKFDFTSERLGFRNWKNDDLDEMLGLNQDPEVMKYFPSLQDKEATAAFIKRMQVQYEAFNYCYFAVEEKNEGEFLGFIGISNQDYGDTLGKFIDIGWRLKRSAWGVGYATEGAKRCLSFAKKDLGLKKLHAVVPKNNQNSIAVTRKIGMKEVLEFEHPKLIKYPRVKQCFLYEINL